MRKISVWFFNRKTTENERKEEKRREHEHFLTKNQTETRQYEDILSQYEDRLRQNEDKRRSSEAEDAYFLQNGYYRFGGKWKTRGLGKLKGRVMDHLDTIEKNGRLYIRYVEFRNTRLRNAIIEHRISDIGKIRPKVREINLNADRKRFWLGRIERIDSEVMNDSLPISLNYFKKDEI